MKLADSSVKLSSTVITTIIKLLFAHCVLRILIVVLPPLRLVTSSRPAHYIMLSTWRFFAKRASFNVFVAFFADSLSSRCTPWTAYRCDLAPALPFRCLLDSCLALQEPGRCIAWNAPFFAQFWFLSCFRGNRTCLLHAHLVPYKWHNTCKSAVSLADALPRTHTSG